MVLSLKQANVVGRSAAVLMPRITCVAFEHIAEYRARRFQGLYGPLLHLLSRRVDEVWADCEQTLDETRRYFVPRHRARHVIPLFVAESHGPFKTDYALAGRVRLAAAGRLIARKHVPLMVARRRSLCVGKASMRRSTSTATARRARAIETLVVERGLQDHVLLAGYQADWVAQAIEADIFLNLSEAEGFCIVVAEAMLAGLPVIAADVGGVRDYGRDGENMLKLCAPTAGDTRYRDPPPFT